MSFFWFLLGLIVGEAICYATVVHLIRKFDKEEMLANFLDDYRD